MEHLGTALSERPCEGLQTAGGLQGMGPLPGQPLPAAPVEHRHPRPAPLRQGHIRDLHTPELGGAGPRHRTQPRGGERVIRRGHTRARLGRQGLPPPGPHPALTARRVDRPAESSHRGGQPCKGVVGSGASSRRIRGQVHGEAVTGAPSHVERFTPIRSQGRRLLRGRWLRSISTRWPATAAGSIFLQPLPCPVEPPHVRGQRPCAFLRLAWVAGATAAEIRAPGL